MRWTTEQYQQYIGNKTKPVKREPVIKRTCIVCKEKILPDDSFGCKAIENTNPVEVDCYHLSCDM